MALEFPLKELSHYIFVLCVRSRFVEKEESVELSSFSFELFLSDRGFLAYPAGLMDLREQPQLTATYCLHINQFRSHDVISSILFYAFLHREIKKEESKCHRTVSG